MGRHSLKREQAMAQAMVVQRARHLNRQRYGSVQFADACRSLGVAISALDSVEDEIRSKRTPPRAGKEEDHG